MSIDEERSHQKALQVDAKRLVKLVEGLAKAKPGSANYLDELQRSLKAIVDEQTLSELSVDVLRQAKQAVEREIQSLADNWKRVEAGFIRGVQEAQIPVRQYDQSWRIAELDMRHQGAESRVRFEFNREPLTGWLRVVSAEQLSTLFEEARSTLHAAAMEDQKRATYIQRAFVASARRAQSSGGAGGKVSVPIRGFLVDLRIEILRAHLEAKGAGAKLTQFVDYPSWALLYNLDLYRQQVNSLDPEVRLGFQTGAQSEGIAGNCVALNGLDAHADYQMYCYVTGVLD